MNALERIRQLKQDYTATEKKLAEYILESQETVIADSAEQLGKKAGVSAATVIRFAKKSGFSGFTDMKLQLAKSEKGRRIVYSEEVEKGDPMSVIIDKTKAMHLQTVDQTYSLIDEGALNDALRLIRHCRRLYLMGVGASGIICDDLYYKFSRVDTKAFFNKDPHTQLTNIAHIGDKDLLLAVSYSGETREVVTAAKFAVQQGAMVVAITKMGASTLRNYADIILEIPASEAELRLGAIRSRIATLIVTDLLFYGYAMNYVDDLESELLKTREIIDDLKL